MRATVTEEVRRGEARDQRPRLLLDVGGLEDVNSFVLGKATATPVQTVAPVQNVVTNNGVQVTITSLVPTSQRSGQVWHYTTDTPSADWFLPGFNDASWKTGEAGFGSDGFRGNASAIGGPPGLARTPWNTSDIWMRREFTLPAGNLDGLKFLLMYDEDTEIYINGVLAAQVTGFTTEYVFVALTTAGRAALKPGTNSLAVHCRQNFGSQYIDVGLSILR